MGNGICLEEWLPGLESKLVQWFKYFFRNQRHENRPAASGIGELTGGTVVRRRPFRFFFDQPS